MTDLKVILLGNVGVGKSNLINVYVGQKFNQNSLSNLTSSLFQKTLIINDQQYDISLWDTAGQERFRTITKSLINGLNIVLYVYSIIDENSFKDLNYWISCVEENINNNYVSAIIGNKNDLYLVQKVNEEEARKFAESKNIRFELCSAKDNPLGFSELLNKLIEEYINKYIIKEKRGRSDSIKLKQEKVITNQQNKQAKTSGKNNCSCN